MFFRKFRAACLLLLLTLVVSPRLARADATAKVEAGRIVMENELLRVVIDPQVGGRIVEYVFKPWDNTNLAFPARDNGGLAMDMFWQQKWPGELLKNPYEFEIVKPGSEEAVVRVWRISTGDAQGKKVEDVAGIRVQRTLRLRAGERALHIGISLQNTTDKGRLAGYWMQNNFFLPGGKESNTWYRPSVHGVDTISTEKPSPNYWYFVEAPTAGWLGVANQKLNGGLMLLMNYNDLWKFYTNMGAVTTEWFYDRVAIPPGKSWNTEVSIVPTPGLGSYAFGSDTLIAALQIEPNANGLQVTHKMTSGTSGLKDVTIRTWAEGARGDWKSKPIEQKVAAIDEQVTTLTTSLPDPQAAPLAVQVEVTGTTSQGKKQTFHYGDFYGGASGRNVNLETLRPLYSFARPLKEKVFLKPDKIVKTKNDHLRVLFVRGLWHEYSGVDEALKQIPNAEVVDSWYDESDTGTSLLNFPPDYDTLLGYDVVVLANIDGGSLGLVGQEMLADFVAAGGGVLFVAGDRTYGQAGFDNANFLKLLPVQIGGSSDWHKLPHAETLMASTTGITRGISFNANTVALYRHMLQPAAGAQVALTVGGAAALVMEQRGAGRVAASLLLPFGEPASGQTGYWQSPQWFGLMRNTLQWLSGNEENPRVTQP
jgi:uncharacterized membrane protein